MPKKKNRKTLQRAPAAPPPDRFERRYLTVLEWRRVLKAADGDPRSSALVRVVYEAALRREEPGILRLSYAKELHRTGRIYVHRGKGSPSGYVDLSDSTAKSLSAWLTLAYEGKKRRPDGFIFPGTRSKGLTGRTVYNIYHGIAVQLGLDKHLQHPHVLKRSRAQHMIEAMVEKGLTPWHALQAIASLIGHASARTTIEHYIQQSGDERKLAQDITEGLLR